VQERVQRQRGRRAELLREHYARYAFLSILEYHRHVAELGNSAVEEIIESVRMNKVVSYFVYGVDRTVRVSHRGSTLLLYACTDCEPNATIRLYGQRGALVITASGRASATLQRHVGRALQLSHTPALITPAQAEAAVLQYNLRAGDAMWIPASGGAVSCEPCLPGLACM